MTIMPISSIGQDKDHRQGLFVRARHRAAVPPLTARYRPGTCTSKWRPSSPITKTMSLLLSTPAQGAAIVQQ